MISFFGVWFSFRSVYESRFANIYRCCFVDILNTMCVSWCFQTKTRFTWRWTTSRLVWQHSQYRRHTENMWLSAYDAHHHQVSIWWLDETVNLWLTDSVRWLRNFVLHICKQSRTKCQLKRKWILPKQTEHIRYVKIVNDFLLITSIFNWHLDSQDTLYRNEIWQKFS